MACSKPISHPTVKETISLIDCAICLREIENPKALPCLHTFCLKCLKQVRHPPGRFVCPLCQENMALPPGGVDNFRDNFSINQLKERKAIYKIGDIKVACICCKSSDRDTLARCIDCNGFLCQQCVNMHQNLTPLMQHNVFTIEEIRSRKVDPNKMMKEQCCQKHTNQVMRWFCKSCGIPICRDCTVMEHTRPDHHYVTLESVIEGHLEDIRRLVATCEGISGEIEAAIIKTDEVKATLHGRLTESSKQLHNAEKRAHDTFLKALQDNDKSTTDQLEHIRKERDDRIESEMKTLHNMRSKLTNAIEMANQVLKSGSKHDIASNYSTLCETLTQLKAMKPTSISHTLSLVKFKPNQKEIAYGVNLGTVSSSLKDRKGKWVLEKEIGKEGPGKILCGNGVAIHPKSCDIYIADDNEKNIKVFDSKGNYKQVIRGNLQTAYDVAISSDGFLFITDRTCFVKVFNPVGTFLRQFTSYGSKGHGITIDKDGNLLVGLIGSNTMSIRKYKLDGRHISAFSMFSVTMDPFFISSTPRGRILITPLGNTMQILDSTGKVLHTISTPKDAKSWNACSSCCSDDGIIYVTSNRGDPDGIYSFTEDGEYLGCVTTDVICAKGIALIDDDRLVVTQHGNLPAKIFSYVE